MLNARYSFLLYIYFKERMLNMAMDQKASQWKKKPQGVNSLSASQNKLLNIFFYSVIVGTMCAMLGIILFYVIAFSAKHHGSASFDWLLGIFSDFVEIMNASLKDSPYITGGTSYPPLAVMVLYPFALICKNAFAPYAAMEGLTVDELPSRVILHPEFWVAIVLFFLLSTSAILFLIIKRYRLDLWASIRVSVIIILSTPFVYAIMRGNTIYFALVFLLLFLLLYEDSRLWVREIAYFCLVLAGSIKIYPLFFGVYLLHKKKFFASFRIAVYFALLFFLSFHLFRTGLEGVDPFMENLGGFIFSDERWLSLRNLSISSLLYKLFYLFSPSATESTAFTVFNLIILGALFLSATVTAIATRSPLSRAMIAASVVILVPSVSYFYVLVFSILPFMEFFTHYDELSLFKKRLYFLSFFFLFFTFFVVPQCFIPHALVILLLLVTEVVTVLRNELLPKIKKQNSNSNKENSYVR